MDPTLRSLAVGSIQSFFFFANCGTPCMEGSKFSYRDGGRSNYVPIDIRLEEVSGGGSSRG